nr:hypothetical protein OG690_37930 [Streptomyces tubercidicus]
MPDENNTPDLPVHEGDTPPDGQVRDMATPEDLAGDQQDRDGGNA